MFEGCLGIYHGRLKHLPANPPFNCELLPSRPRHSGPFGKRAKQMVIFGEKSGQLTRSRASETSPDRLASGGLHPSPRPPEGNHRRSQPEATPTPQRTGPETAPGSPGRSVCFPMNFQGLRSPATPRLRLVPPLDWRTRVLPKKRPEVLRQCPTWRNLPRPRTICRRCARVTRWSSQISQGASWQ